MKNMLAAAEKRVKADMRPIQEKMKLDRNVTGTEVDVTRVS